MCYSKTLRLHLLFLAKKNVQKTIYDIMNNYDKAILMHNGTKEEICQNIE